MKRYLFILIFLGCASMARAQNVNATVVTKAVTLTTLAYSSSRVIKATKGALVSITVHNSVTAAYYLYVVDAAAVPADATTIKDIIVPATKILTDSTLMIVFPVPASATNGIVAWLDTDGDLTKSETAVPTGIFITAQYQ